MTTLEKLKNSVVPSIFAGGMGVAVYYLMYDKDLMSTAPLGPIEVPVALAVAGTTMLGNMAGEVLTNFVLPMIPKNEEFQKYEEMIIPPVLAGVSTVLAMKFLVSPNTFTTEAFIVGAAGSVGGKYIYGMI